MDALFSAVWLNSAGVTVTTVTQHQFCQAWGSRGEGTASGQQMADGSAKAV